MDKMEFRDLKAQYIHNKECIDQAIQRVLDKANFILGSEVQELEAQLADYVETKNCVTCGNGTDALQMALMAWDVGIGDAVFVPDFTFFSTGEAVATVGATPIFVDVEWTTCNISVEDLNDKIEKVFEEGQLVPKAIIAVDLFGVPADFHAIRKLTEKFGLLLLEDGAQGFGGQAKSRMACSFGDISTTSFFPAKPLGCYGDGGALFTDNDEWAEKIRSLRIHGKGKDKYDNIRIGLNSRLDTLQAAILLEKFKAFREYELECVNQVALWYNNALKEAVEVPIIGQDFISSWAQYTIKLRNTEERQNVINVLEKNNIPCAIYYRQAMRKQSAFKGTKVIDNKTVTDQLCERVLSLPMHPYLTKGEIDTIAGVICSAI